MRTELGFLALMLGMLLAHLDTNIVVAALPSVGRELVRVPRSRVSLPRTCWL